MDAVCTVVVDLHIIIIGARGKPTASKGNTRQKQQSVSQSFHSFVRLFLSFFPSSPLSILKFIILSIQSYFLFSLALPSFFHRFIFPLLLPFCLPPSLFSLSLPFLPNPSQHLSFCPSFLHFFLSTFLLTFPLSFLPSFHPVFFPSYLLNLRNKRL